MADSISPSLVPLFIASAAALALTTSHTASSSTISPLPSGSSTPALAKGEMPTVHPKDAADAVRMVEEEKEEEALNAEEMGLTIPPGGPRPALIIVMGPASCGKSSVGLGISSRLSIPFIDGDSLHPQSNVDKMSAGIPLDDNDRLPWLALIRSTAERVCREQWEKGAFTTGAVAPGGVASGKTLGRPAVIIACSALKKWYRDILRGEVEAQPPSKDDLPATTQGQSKVHKAATDRLDTYFVYCKGSREVLWERISSRKGHFMGAQMLDSQLKTLESPEGEDGVAVVDITLPPEEEFNQAVEGVLKVAGGRQ